MAYHLDLALNEGVQICVPQQPIYVIVREISGTSEDRNAQVEIRSLGKIAKLHLRRNSSLVTIAENVKIGISHYGEPDNKAEINFDSPYRISRRYTFKRT